jgi:hypothetical protein
MGWRDNGDGEDGNSCDWPFITIWDSEFDARRDLTDYTASDL